jgi:transporter family-2 protein
MGFLIALISGALMSIQGVFNTGVTKQTSIWVASAFVQLTALVVCLLAWVVTGREGTFGSLFKIEDKYMLLGGAIGAFITFTVIQSVGSLGPARAIMLIVTAQLVTAYIIELFGIFGQEKVAFQWRKIVGLVLIVAGILTFKWKD